MFDPTFNYKNIQKDILDSYLQIGWYRTGQGMFTCEFLPYNDVLFYALWLRNELSTFEFGTSFNKIAKRNKQFIIETKPLFITTAHEALYYEYKKGIAFEGMPSLCHLLYDDEFVVKNKFNTMEINIYDKDKLIGCTYFDLGAKSAAGISAFYNPAYKAHSLGKYLIYLQIKYCIEQGLTYFYPGYFVPGCKPFDYKLDFGYNSLQYFDTHSNKWLPINGYTLKPMELYLKYVVKSIYDV
jgi:leucyl-tRNA---protein transferase